MVQVGLHEASLLSPLLLAIVLEALSREMRYAAQNNCFILMFGIGCVSLKGFKGKVQAWKEVLGSKVLRGK